MGDPAWIIMGCILKNFFCSAEKRALQVGLWYSLGPTKPAQSSSLQMLICFWVLASPCTAHPTRSKPPRLEGFWMPCPAVMKPEGILIMCWQKYHIGFLDKRGKESRKDCGCAVVVSWSLIIEKCFMFKVVFCRAIDERGLIVWMQKTNLLIVQISFYTSPAIAKNSNNDTIGISE